MIRGLSNAEILFLSQTALIGPEAMIDVRFLRICMGWKGDEEGQTVQGTLALDCVGRLVHVG